MENNEIAKYNCALCYENGCYKKNMDKVTMPKCPTKYEKERIDEITKKYNGEELKIAKVAAEIAVDRYGGKSRIEETIEFIKKMEYKKVGLAFCYALKEEARLFANLLDVTLNAKTVLTPTKNEEISKKDKEAVKIKLESVMCKMGSIDREKLGLKDFDSDSIPMCNPIAQAIFLNEQKAKVNILLGLCVGHDYLFNMFAEAPSIVLAVKDRLYDHNPIEGFRDENGYCITTLKEKRPYALRPKNN